jgi:hypothetical protein
MLFLPLLPGGLDCLVVALDQVCSVELWGGCYLEKHLGVMEVVVDLEAVAVEEEEVAVEEVAVVVVVVANNSAKEGSAEVHNRISTFCISRVHMIWRIRMFARGLMQDAVNIV